MQSEPPRYDQKGNAEVNYGYSGGYAPPPQAGYGHVVHTQPVGGTTVVVQQQPVIQAKRSWDTGVFDCCEDCGICLCGAFCGLCLMCQNATDMNESMCVACCVPAPLTVLRTKWRTQNNIEGTIMNDCLMETCCGPCASCQLARELKNAKMNPSYQMR